MKQNIEFFDTLDQGWEETLANTYENANSIKIKPVKDSEGRLVIEKSQHNGDESLIGTIILPKGVEIIHKNAFTDCKNITGVNFPASLKYIHMFAFDGCDNLSGHLNFNEGLTRIQAFSFASCPNLTTISIPSTMNNIDSFSFCESGLTGDLNIPGTIKYVGSGAFKGCKNLNGTLTLEEGLQRILYNSFKDCPFTGELHIPESVYAIEQSAFDGCKFDVIYVNEHMSKIWDKHWKHGCDAEIKYY